MYILSLFSNVVNYDSDNGWTTLLDKFKTVPTITQEVETALVKLKNQNITNITSAEELGNIVGYTNEEFFKFAKTADTSGDLLEQYRQHLEKSAKSTSKFGAALKTITANIGISLAISAAITLISKLVTSYSEMADKAREATNTFKEQSSSIESNKQSITELRNAIDSGNLSYSEATEKREELLSIQRELLSSYGSEVEGIDLVNGSLEEQIALLDEVTEKNRQAWKNSVNELSNASEIWNWWTSVSSTFVDQTVNPFNNLERTGKLLGNLIDGESFKDSYKEYLGYADTATELFGTNIDQITDKVENFEAKFKATDNTYLNNLIKSFDGVKFDGKKFTIEGNVEDVSNTITTIQSQLKEIPGYTNEIDNQLTEIYNDAQKIATESLETYKTAIQKEILDDNSENGLKQYYMNLSEAYKQYQDALVEGDESAIEKAKSSYSDIMSSILSSGKDEKYINYFSDLYPDLKSVVDDWNFETKITPNLDEFKNNKLLKDFSTDEIFEQFKEGGNNLSSYQKSELAEINEMATQYGMSLDDFLVKLNEVGVAQSQVKKDFLEKIDFNGRSNADPVKQYLSSLANEEYTILLDAEIPISSKTWVEKDWENFIEQLKFKAGKLTIEFDPETAFKSMTTALSEQSEKGYLTDETMQSLKGTYGDLTDILTYSENGIVLNTEAMVDLTNQTAEAALVSTRMKESLAVKDYQTAARQLNNYKQEHVGLEDALNGSTSELNDFLSSLDETERVDIQNTIDQMQTLSDTINEYDALEAKIRATTSALNDYVRATSTANNADNFDTARGGLENAKKMYENGWTGKDDYKTYIDYIGKYNEEMNNYQSPEDYFSRAQRYLTEDISGIYNFLDDAAKLNNGWVTNINGQYDIAINDLNKFAQDMDMSLSFVTDMLLATTETWDFDVDFSSLSEGLVDGLTKIDLESENARTNLEDFRSSIEALDNAGYDTTELWNQFHAVEDEFNKDIQFTLSISDMSEDELLKEAENVADDVAKKIGENEIKFNLGLDDTNDLIDRVAEYRKGLKEGSAEYNKAQLVMAQLIQQKQELETPAIMSVDTTGMSDEMSGAISLVQQWVDASNELERTQALGLDTTQAQAQLDSLTTKLSSVSSTTLANLGLNITGESSIQEIKSQIASIDVNNLAKNTEVKITANTFKAEQLLNQFKYKVDNTIGTVKIDGQLTPNFVTDVQNAINNHTYNAKINATVNGGKAKAKGSAHIRGSAYAGGKGKWTVGVKDNNALVGEEGYEIRVRNGIYETIGQNGAEFTDVRPDDIIFNHKQSEELLKYGHTNSRGKSFVKGSAYNGGKEQVTGSGGSGWKNSSSTSKSKPKSKSKSKDKEKKSSKTLMDWIERRINVLTQKAERWSKIIENATNPKRLDSYYKKLEENYKKQLKTYSDGATRYLQKAKSIKLSSDLKNKVKSKDFSIFNKDGSMKSYKSLIKEYGEKTAKKIQDYQNYIDKYESAIDSFIETSQKLYQAPIEKAADKIELLSESLDLLDAKLDNISVDDYKKANANLDEQSKNAKAQMEANKEAEKTAKNNFNSAKSAVTQKSNLESNDLAGNKKKRDSSTKSIKNAVSKGEEIDLTLYKAGSSGYKAAVKYNAALKAQKDAIDAAALSQEEYTKILSENAKEKFENIKKYYESQIDLIDASENAIKDQVDLLEAKGMSLTAKYYDDQIAYEKQKQAQLQKSKAELETQLKYIVKGTDEWYDAKSAIAEVNSELVDCNKSIAEMNSSITTIADNFMDKMIGVGNTIMDTMDWAVSLMDNIDTFNSETGMMTKEGFATLGSYVSGYNTSGAMSEMYRKLTFNLESNYNKKILSFVDANGIKRTYNSLEEFKAAIYDTYEEWRDQISKTHDYESKIVDMMKKKLENELSALKDLIDAKEKALDAEKDLYNYQKSIRESTQNVASLEKQIAAIQGDTSEETSMRIQKLQKELSDEREDLQEKEYDRYISDQQDMLDKLYDEYESFINSEMQDVKKLLADGISIAQSIAGDIEKTVNDYVEPYDYNGRFDSLDTAISNITNDSDSSIANTIKNIANEGVENATQSTGTVTVNGESHGTGYKKIEAIPETLKTPVLKTLPDITPTTKAEAIKVDGKSALSAAKSYVKKHAVKAGKKKSEYSDVNKVIYDNKAKAYSGTGKVLSDTSLKGLAKELGIKYDNSKKSGKLYTTLKKIKFPGFKKGGIVSVDDIEKQVHNNGDDGLVSVKNGEGFIPVEMMPQFKELIENMPVMNDLTKSLAETPDFSNLTPVMQNEKVENTIDLSITLPNVKNYNEFMSQMQADPRFTKLVQSIGIDQSLGGARLAKNKIHF